MDFDAIVVGAGFAGATMARELVERAHKKVLVLESRDHIGGNCYDAVNEDGIMVHVYGPHTFHTSNKRVYDYLSRFCEWNGFVLRTKALIQGKHVPVPFNLTSLHELFPKEKADSLEKKLIDRFGLETRAKILELRQVDDPEIRELADFIYENVFLHYTMKQWGQKPEDIDPTVTARVPISISYDDRYFTDPYEGIPKEGYTKLIETMLNHPDITVRLNSDARKLLNIESTPVQFEGKPFTGLIIYSGPADQLFNCKFGQLPYRTLDFKWETLPQTEFQPSAIVNYTTSEDFTRITESKHMTFQKVEGKTTIAREYSRAYQGGDEIPYYPINNPETQALYKQYKDLADKIPNLHLVGRLAEYKYYNIDQLVGHALESADAIIAKL